MQDQTNGMAQSKQVEKDLASSCHSLFTSSLFVTCHVTQVSNNESVPHVRKFMQTLLQSYYKISKFASIKKIIQLRCQRTPHASI